MIDSLTSDTIPALLGEPELTIKAWSFSRVSEFEKCAYRAKLLYVQKLTEPQPPLKPGQTEYPNDRGTRVHSASEAFIKGGVELVPELSKFRPEYEKLREHYAEGKVSVEEEWAFNDAWQPVGWFSQDCWLRLKCDATDLIDPTHLLVVDLKTGKKVNNELKHADQMALYAVCAFMRNPALEKVTVELWYADQDDLTRQVYSRAQAMKHFKRFNERGLAMTTATEFEPNPNQYTCRFCRFGPKGNSVCTVGV